LLATTTLLVSIMTVQGDLKMTWIRMPILALALAAIGGMAAAQDDFPTKPVHIYVPFPPGGAVDIVGRTLGDELSKRWGQTVVIENRPGAGGTIATQALARAPADGYTLIIIATGHALNPHLYDKLPYDTFVDFTPISLIGSSTNLFLVKASSPIKTFPDLLATARAQPGKLSFGHAGNGTSSHLAGELVNYMAKVAIGSVPYRGGAPALNDLIGGHIPLSINNVPESKAQLDAGAVRALGVTTAMRSPVLPSVPTVAEAALPGYDTGLWWGVVAPAGLPPMVKAKLERSIAEAVKAAGVSQRLLGLGAAPVGSTADEFAALIRAEYDKWGPVVKAAGIRGE
jgi:tripartite-type tricarboxylate transporter receptor subunit TctC